jgi:hypothetical protein
LIKKRVKSHIVEQVLFSVMILFIVPIAFIIKEILSSGITYVNALILSLVIIIVAMFMQTILMVRIFQKYED